jgi:hypothetical protein
LGHRNNNRRKIQLSTEYTRQIDQNTYIDRPNSGPIPWYFLYRRYRRTISEFFYSGLLPLVFDRNCCCACMCMCMCVCLCLWYDSHQSLAYFKTKQLPLLLLPSFLLHLSSSFTHTPSSPPQVILFISSYIINPLFASGSV